MNLKLYEVAADVGALLEDGIDPETGEMSPELALALARFDDKGASVAAYVLNTEAEAEAVDAVIKRLAARKSAIVNRAKHIREYLQRHMAALGIERIDANDKSFSVRLYRDRDSAVEIEPDAVLTEAFQRVTIVPDKAALTRAIKAGEPVPAGVRLVFRDRLTIG